MNAPWQQQQELMRQQQEQVRRQQELMRQQQDLMRRQEETRQQMDQHVRAEQPADNEGNRDIPYHKRIMGVSVFLGALGFMIGLFFAGRVKSPTQLSPTQLKEQFVGLCLFAIFGFLFGFAVMCLFAPAQFLNGMSGQKWMRVIGTTRVLVVRVVCFIVTAALVGVGFLVLFGK